MLELPVACTLAPAELADRRAAWVEVLEGSALRARVDVEGGLRLTFAPADGLEARVRELCRLESACCAFADWRVSRSGDALVLEVTAPTPEGEAAVRAMLS